MLARERPILHDRRKLFQTPLLIPSFSSKGFPEMRKIIELMKEFITDVVLVSAYDQHYRHLDARKITFPTVIFLDSGGYEARVEHDLSEAYGQDYKPAQWTIHNHRNVLRDWKSSVPTVAVNFDSPRRHYALAQQIALASRLKDEFPQFPHEFLIKPSPKQRWVDLDSIAPMVEALQGFTVIGLTEYELDDTLLGRMEKIARFRMILDSANVTAPIHIFGSLDTFSTPLYFLSGAEIFDGLTWLRFGFLNGQTIYKHNYGARSGTNGIIKTSLDLVHTMWKDNYYYLQSLRDEMCGYVHTSDFNSFKHIGPQLEQAFHQLEARLG